MFPGKDSSIEMSNQFNLEYVNCTLSFSMDLILLNIFFFIFSESRKEQL